MLFPGLQITMKNIFMHEGYRSFEASAVSIIDIELKTTKKNTFIVW